MHIEYPEALQGKFEGAILGGDFDPQEVLAIGDLAARYGASPDKMRQVVLTAVRKGLVEWADQDGERLCILGLPESDLDSVFTHTAKSGLKPRSFVREVVVEPAEPVVAQKLDVEEGSPVYRYVRTRNVAGQALANQTNYMPYGVCPGLEHDDVSNYSFQRLMEEKYAAVLTEMDEVFSLVPASCEDRTILDLPEGSSVLVIDRIALGATGWPLVWADIRIRPDRYEYVAALWPKAAELLESQ